MAEAALATVDQVLLVLPGILPHKVWEGASPEQRADMLKLVTAHRAGIGAAMAEGGLFAEIAEEARAIYPKAELYMICGRDAAERIVGWNYGKPGAIERYLEEFHLLVAPREGCYEAPPHIAHAVHLLSMPSHDMYASTRVRQRSEGWRDLVPDEIAHLVESIYQ